MTVINYKNYRPELRKEFLYSCGYCNITEPELGGSEAFHVDHYKPKSKFPHLVCKYTNLIYACRNCNRFKGDYWPNFIEKVQEKFILNPRADSFQEHLNQSDFAWVGITARGKWTVLRLRLDSEYLVRLRQDRVRIENAIKKLEEILVKSKLGLSIAIQRDVEELEIQELHHDIDEQIEQINALRRKILGPVD